MDHFLEFLIALDQLLNTLLGGWADETVSARAYRLGEKKKRWAIAHVVIDAIFFWQKNHCEQAYFSEVQRVYSPVDMRK